MAFVSGSVPLWTLGFHSAFQGTLDLGAEFFSGSTRARQPSSEFAFVVGFPARLSF